MKYVISTYISILLTFSASHVHANEGPNIEESEEIILDNTNNISEDKRGISTQIVGFPKHCLMTTKSTVRNNGKVWIIIETKTPIDLSKLDPSTVEPIGSRGFRVLARSTADNFLFDYTKTFYLKLDINRNFEAYNCDVNKCPPIIEKANPYVSITGLSSKSVRIVAKAFTHLIKLCGGKEQ